MLPQSVTVTVPARLHLGFLDLNGGLGRRFGSLGLAISMLRTRVMIRAAARTEITGPDSERAARHLAAMQRLIGSDGAWRVSIEEAVPPHAGLGSGTQLALAIAAGLRRLHGLPLDPRGDAARLGRGARSGTGTALFVHGGFVVDGGRGPDDTVPPVISALPFPEPWRVLVVLDPSRQGMHGREETAAFAALPTFPADDAAHLCRLVLMQVLPALAEGDLDTFGAAITELQASLGDHYAPVQGGSRFTSPDVAAVLDHLGRAGAVGIGQSSWGPTGFAFAASPDEAEWLARGARGVAAGRGLDIRVCAGLNREAGIELGAAADAPP
jgi:beta-ribofuranosylaminobenzene 5'-phosphate synthase